MPAKRDTPEKFTFNGKEYNLSERQKLFCMEYVRNKFNGAQAALAAGYSKKNSVVSGSHLLSIPNVQDFINDLKKDIAFCIGISAIDIAKEYARIGFSDIRKVFDDQGNLVKIKNMETDVAANIASIDIFEEFQSDGKGNKKSIGFTKRVKLYDKVNALDKLAKMIGADGVTKTAVVDSKGNDVVMLPKKDF